MKKFFFWFFTLIQLLFFIGIFFLEKLSYQYMTIMRIVLYKKRTWEAAFPMDRLLSVAHTVLIVLAVLAILLLILQRIKIKGFRFHGHLQLLVLGIIAGGSAFFIAAYSTDIIRTYYYAVAFLLIITAMQLIKSLLYIRTCPKM